MAETTPLSAARCSCQAPPASYRRLSVLCKSSVSSPVRLCRTQGVDHALKPTSGSRSVAFPARIKARKEPYSTVPHATLQGSLVNEPRSSGGARELLTWISELPWARVAIWLTVALTAAQFQDFFGVGIALELSTSELCLLTFFL